MSVGPNPLLNVLTVIADALALSQDDIQDKTGLPADQTREILERLTERGWVKARPAGAQGIYAVTAAGARLLDTTTKRGVVVPLDNLA